MSSVVAIVAKPTGSSAIPSFNEMQTSVVAKPTGSLAIPSFNEMQTSVVSRVDSVWKFVKEKVISFSNWGVNDLYPRIREAVDLVIRDARIYEKSQFIRDWAAKNVFFVGASLCLTTATYLMTGSLSAALCIGSDSLLSSIAVDERFLALLREEESVKGEVLVNNEENPLVAPTITTV